MGLSQRIDQPEEAGLPSIRDGDLSPDIIEALSIARLGIWNWVAGSQSFSWSDELYRIAGRDPATFAPTLDSTIACVHPDDRATGIERLMIAAAGDETHGHEFRLVRPDGEIRQCWAKLQPIREQGEVVRVRGVLLDITDRIAAERRQAESDEHYRYTVELNPHIPWTADANGDVLSVSSRWLAKVGMSDDQTRGRGWAEALHPDDHEATFREWDKSLRTGAPLDVRYRIRMKDGSDRWFRARAGARRDDRGAIMRWYGVVEDIDEQVRAEIALRETEERYRLAARATNDLIWDHDIAADRIQWVDFPERRFGYATAELGTDSIWWRAQVHPRDRERVAQRVRAIELSGASQFAEEYRFRRGDSGFADVYVRGYIQRDDKGRSVRVVGAMQDITERKRAAAALMDSQARLRWGATHDALTGVANRALFQEVLADAIKRAEAGGHCVGLLELDVDEFKHVNDTLGHDAGDALLRTLVARLGDLLGPADTLARLGGDEFAIILPDLGEAESLDPVVARIVARMREPFAFEGHTLDCRATIGSSLYPRHGRTPEELLKSADIALSMAKAAGRGQHLSFLPGMRAELQHRMSMLHVARDALASETIRPFYQPKVALADGRVTGFEALLRWRDRCGFANGPDTLAAAFEDHVLAAELSDRMIELTVADMRRWLDRGVDFGHVAVNAAAAEFRNEDFAEGILEALRRADVPFNRFQLEVTETVFLGRGAESVERALRTLSDEGVRIALDDFGTGYASLRHLNLFPVDILKIDQSFVRGVEDDAGDMAIIRALVGLGQSLDIDVIAEGIETHAQADALRRLGCTYGQGYLYSKAVAAEDVPALLARGVVAAARA